jgi:VanZ family protein
MPGGAEHAIAYFGTSTAFLLGYPRHRLLIAVALTLYGGLMEVFQGFVPGPGPAALDALASGGQAAPGSISILLVGAPGRAAPLILLRITLSCARLPRSSMA